MNLPILWEIVQMVDILWDRRGRRVFILAYESSVGCVQHHVREWEQDQQ